MKKALIATLLLASVTATAWAEEDHPITKRAREVGVSQCLSAIDQVARYLVGTEDLPNASWYSFWTKDDADRHPYQVTIERTYEDGAALFNMTVAPSPNGECDFAYMKVFPFDKSCTGVASSIFKESTYKETLNKRVEVFEKNAMVNYAIPSGNGCTAVIEEHGTLPGKPAGK